MSIPPHILVIPFPQQGHVNPMMDFSRYLARGGVKITFVNTEFNQKRIVDATANKEVDGLIGDDNIHLVSIPDGLAEVDDRNDSPKLIEAMLRILPAKLVELINSNNQSKDLEGPGPIKCVLLDATMAFALQITHKLGIRGALFSVVSAVHLSHFLSIPRLISEGIIDNNGIPKKHTFQLSPSAPVIDTKNFFWCCFDAKEMVFKLLASSIQVSQIAEWWFCNTTYDLEPEAFSLFPKLKPIGPLMASHHKGNAGAQFLPEDSTCLNWLDQQPARSVIYVAFGSIATFEPLQVDELAYGLELSNRPYLWVVRPGITNESSYRYPDGLKGTQGKIVNWAPQQKVLSHPAIACFLSHCGWNSTIEGLSNGVPFLCWPYFADQFLDQEYICDVWKVGLKFDRDENGIITRKEITKKVDQLLSDEHIKARSSKIKEMVNKNVTESGRSSKNINEFIQWLKE